MADNSNTVLANVASVSASDVTALQEAERHYGDSWKRRGGVGAFMMLARKWDRIENRVRLSASGPNGAQIDPWDVLGHIAADARAEGLIDDIRDLRRYLLLVEAEARRLGLGAARTKSRDEHGSVIALVLDRASLMRAFSPITWSELRQQTIERCRAQKELEAAVASSLQNGLLTILNTVAVVRVGRILQDIRGEEAATASYKIRLYDQDVLVRRSSEANPDPIEVFFRFDDEPETAVRTISYLRGFLTIDEGREIPVLLTP